MKSYLPGHGPNSPQYQNAFADFLPEISRVEGVLFFQVAANSRMSIATSIERLIDLLDAMETDPDLECTADDEPSLGWNDRGPVPCVSAQFGYEDCELDTSDDEDDGTLEEEPDIEADSSDDEPDSDSEPDLGWGNICGQGPRLDLGSKEVGRTDLEVIDPSGDTTFRHLGFDGQGHLDGRDLLRASIRNPRLLDAALSRTRVSPGLGRGF